jgi:hypothetical protein
MTDGHGGDRERERDVRVCSRVRASSPSIYNVGGRPLGGRKKHVGHVRFQNKQRSAQGRALPFQCTQVISPATEGKRFYGSSGSIHMDGESRMDVRRLLCLTTPKFYLLLQSEFQQYKLEQIP